MEELPQPKNVIRKSAFGRTQLFLPTTTDLIREVKCMGGVTKHDAATVYHVMNDARKEATACCWHCAESIENEDTVVPLPRVYDSAEGVFHTYGRTCSPGCAKAYILEHTSFDRGQHLNVLIKMLREVYDFTDNIVETPPRPGLKKFGGVFDTKRKNKRVRCRLLQPPFVSYCMLVEEQMNVDTKKKLLNIVPMETDDDMLDEPHPEGIYERFVKQKEDEKKKRKVGTTEEGSSSSSNGPLPARKVAKGPMSKFVRQ